LDGYLFDTCTVGDYFCEHPNVMARVRALPDSTIIAVSAITLGEIMFGHSLTHSTDHQRRDDFERWINNNFPMALPVTRHTRVFYGDLKAELFRRFPPASRKENHPERCVDRVTGSELGIDENDLWIAAQALERNLVLVTSDEMRNIRSVALALDVEDWTDHL
jgi:tRNA(fMet)-specific endonuclease VapC